MPTSGGTRAKIGKGVVRVGRGVDGHRLRSGLLSTLQGSALTRLFRRSCSMSVP
jgi:hypothetical protein